MQDTLADQVGPASADGPGSTAGAAGPARAASAAEAGPTGDMVEPEPAGPPLPRGPEAWRLNVLGPVELCYDSRPVAVAGLARDLLALLARTPGEEVPAASIVANLWGTQLPEDAQNVVASQVSRLRKALTVVAPDVDPTGVIVTTPTGYILHIGASNVDAETFERLLADGRRALVVGQPALALARLESGLRLWRGAAYSDFDDQPFTRAEAQRLEDLRLAAIEATVEARLALAAPQVPPELLGEVRNLLVEHWHRERLWVHLMTALFRLGRRGDALAALREAEARLVRDLTIEPGPELRFTERAVLDNDPALNGVPLRASTPPPALTVAEPACVGREQEVGWLLAALDMAATRRAQARLVVGSPGIGKTRLMAEVAQRAAERGVAIRYGNGDPDAPGGLHDALVVDHDRLNLIVLDDLDLAPTEDVLDVVRFIRSNVDRPVLTLPTCRDQVRVGELAGLPKLVLTALGDPAVADIVRLYAPDTTAAAAVAAMVNACGVPSRLHRSASEWAFARAGRRIDRAVASVGEPTRWLASVRDEVVAGVLELDHVRRRARPLRPSGRSVTGSPYRGLARYEVADAELFRGRERTVAEVVARLVDPPLLAVVGGPGSGKSSLVRAGVLPAIAAGVLPGSGRWRQLLVTPGGAAELALRLAEEEEADEPVVEAELAELTDVADFDAVAADGGQSSQPSDLAAESTVEPVGGRREPATGGRPSHTLLVVDQFEDAFALVPAARSELFATLAEAAVSGEVTVLLVLRSDAFARCAEHPQLAGLVAASAYFLAPMSAEDLRRAIEEPAALAGVRVEPELVDALVADAGPAGLPALSAGLSTLWVHRSDGVMRLAAYRAVGGLSRAVEQIGERAFATLTPTQRDVAAEILVALATDPRAAWSGASGGERATVLALLCECGVVSIVDDRPELVHEVLLERWPRLRGWLAERQAERDLRAHLTASTRQWVESGQAPDSLYGGARLAAAVEYADEHEVSPGEREFLAAGQRVLFADEVVRRQQVTRLRYIVVALALVLATALAAGVMVFLAWQGATTANQRADAARIAARGAAEPDLRSGLRLAATGAVLGPSGETTAALRATLLRSPDLMAVAGELVECVATSPDGTMVAAGSAGGDVWLFQAGTLAGTGHLAYPGHSGVAGLAFTPDGRSLVGWGASGIVRWDLGTGQPDGAAFGATGADAGVSGGLADDGDTLVLARPGAAPVAWSLAARTPSTAYQLPASPVSAALVSSDGSVIAFATSGGTTIMMLPSGHTHTLGGAGRPLALDASGRTLIAADGTSVAVWDVAAGTRTGAIAFPGTARAAAWATGRFAVAGEDGTIVVYDGAGSAALRTLIGDRRAVGALHFGPEGSTLYSVTTSGGVMAWDLTGTRGIAAAVSTADRAQLVAQACRLAGRDFTPSEWATAVPGYSYRKVC